MAEISDKTKTREQLVEELRWLRQRGVSDGGHPADQNPADQNPKAHVDRNVAAGAKHPVAALERRSTQLQTAAEVSRAVSSILNLDALIPQVVDLVRERFGLYYAGLFLVDETGEWTGERGSEPGGRWAVWSSGSIPRR